MAEPISKEAAELLRPWEAPWLAMYQHVTEADDETLAELEAACRECSAVNCWYVTYEVAQQFLYLIQTEKGYRERVKAKREAEAAE